jgi:hypothetical protein
MQAVKLLSCGRFLVFLQSRAFSYPGKYFGAINILTLPGLSLISSCALRN